MAKAKVKKAKTVTLKLSEDEASAVMLCVGGSNPSPHDVYDKKFMKSPAGRVWSALEYLFEDFDSAGRRTNGHTVDGRAYFTLSKSPHRLL